VALMARRASLRVDALTTAAPRARGLDSQTGGDTADGSLAATTTVHGAAARVSGSNTMACASLHNWKRK
jgi:hypothetical protein